MYIAAYIHALRLMIIARFVTSHVIILSLCLLLLLLYLSCRSSESTNHGSNNTMDMPVHSNRRYFQAPAHTGASNSTTKARGDCRSQAATVTVEDGASDPDYSSFGPDYESIDSNGSKQPQRRREVPAGRLSERYEYSEAHLATLDEEGLAGASYEVPLSLRQHVTTESENYSHLKH